MFDLVHSQFEKGSWSLDLEKAGPSWLRPFTSLGPIRGRLLVFSMLGFSALMTYLRYPERWLLPESGLGETPPFFPRQVQLVFTWGLAGLAMVIYVLVALIRKERFTLEVDRAGSAFRYLHVPKGSLNPSRDGLVPFSAIDVIKVHGPQARSDCPFGFIEIKTHDTGPMKQVSWRFMSDEQRSFFPLNLSKLTGKTPVGDWVDPDDSPRNPR